MTRALVPLADGVEEMEAVIGIDTLRRAGWDVVASRVPGPVSQPVLASRGVRLLADSEWEATDPSEFDVLFIPGGAGGVAILCQCLSLLQAIRDFNDAGKLLAAICAGPLVLQAAGVLGGRTVTSHPAVREQLRGCELADDPVVSDGHILTSQGPGTAMAFALQLVRRVDGPARAEAIAGPMVTA